MKKKGSVVIERNGNYLHVILSGIDAEVKVKGEGYGYIKQEDSWDVRYTITTPRARLSFDWMVRE